MWASPSPALCSHRRRGAPRRWQAQRRLLGMTGTSGSAWWALHPLHGGGATPPAAQAAHPWSRSRRPRCPRRRRRRAQRRRPPARAPCGRRRWSWRRLSPLHQQPQPPASGPRKAPEPDVGAASMADVTAAEGMRSHRMQLFRHRDCAGLGGPHLAGTCRPHHGNGVMSSR